MKYCGMFLLSLIFAIPAYAIERPLSPEVLIEKSLIARSMLEKEKVHTFSKKLKNKNVVFAKEIILAVYSPSRDSITLIKLKTPIAQPRNPKEFIFSVLTPGYSVEWLQGRGPVRLAFKIIGADGEDMILLDARHLYFEKDPTYGAGEETSYFPVTNDFLGKEFVYHGLDFLLSKVEDAKDELCDLNVSSRSFPGEKLCKVFPNALLMSLAFIEQIDDGEFNGGCPVDNCSRYSASKVLAHLARNGENAFDYSVSSTGARGLMQFMNSKRIPTYNFIKNKYPDAKIIPDFMKGTRDIKNSIKAAICLLDYDLSILPEGAKQEFLVNSKIGGIFPVAAYNGGPLRAINLFKVIGNKEIDLNNLKIPKKTLKNETRGYIQKYVTIWDVIETIFLEAQISIK